MATWAPITYRGFWDVPRIFFVTVGGDLFLFDCCFDEELEDYPESYRVFRMPPLSEDDFAGSWADLYRRADCELARVPVERVTLDATRRKAIDVAVLDALLAPVGRRGEKVG